MDFKPPVAGPLKQPENDTKDNTTNNTLTEQEMKNKLFNEVIPKNETKETLIQFVRWRTRVYDQQKSRSLSDVFAEDFQQFIKNDFESLDKDTRYNLRDCLRVNEMYVRKRRDIAVSQALTEIV